MSAGRGRRTLAALVAAALLAGPARARPFGADTRHALTFEPVTLVTSGLATALSGSPILVLSAGYQGRYRGRWGLGTDLLLVVVAPGADRFGASLLTAGPRIFFADGGVGGGWLQPTVAAVAGGDGTELLVSPALGFQAGWNWITGRGVTATLGFGLVVPLDPSLASDVPVVPATKLGVGASW